MRIRVLIGVCLILGGSGSASAQRRVYSDGIRQDNVLYVNLPSDISDLPAFFGPRIIGEQRQLQVIRFPVSVRVLPGQREPAQPASAPQ